MKPRLLRPFIASVVPPPDALYHWTNFAKATTAIKNNKLSARRWEHYIEAEDRMVVGTSWSTLPNHWQFAYTVRFTVAASSIPNKKFEINGDRVYYQTKARSGEGDTEKLTRQYQVYSPDKITETFVEGTITGFTSLINQIEIQGYPDPYLFDLLKEKAFVQGEGSRSARMTWTHGEDMPQSQ